MTKKKVKLHIFFSWQSDSPKKTNLNAIRKALGDACKRLGAAYPELELVPDEATRDTSGSPRITDKIVEKIEAAAIFIADITTVTSPEAPRPCPNPNVGFELGYAVATLGWDRIVLLFNNAVAIFPADLPFDFAQNRATPYHYASSDPDSKRDALSKLIEVAIKAIIDKNPKRPAELKGLIREKIEHDHDVENMRWLMKAIHIPTLQDLIDELPHRVTDRAMWFHENFRGVTANALFSLYDPVLRSAVDRLHSGWLKALSHGEEYTSVSGGLYIFSSPGDAPLNVERQAAWDEIEAGRTEMAEGITAILERLRSDYLEINIQKTNKRAWKNYVGFHREFEANINNAVKRGKKVENN